MAKPDKKNNLNKSFLAAFRGLLIIFKQERNAKIHLTAAILVTIAGFIFDISVIEWMLILILFGVVISLEMINTAIEKLADITEPDESNPVRDLKDIAAGAVLWSSIVSVIIGIIIFAPEIIEFIKTYTNQ